MGTKPNIRSLFTHRRFFPYRLESLGLQHFSGRSKWISIPQHQKYTFPLEYRTDGVGKREKAESKREKREKRVSLYIIEENIGLYSGGGVVVLCPNQCTTCTMSTCTACRVSPIHSPYCTRSRAFPLPCRDVKN